MLDPHEVGAGWFALNDALELEVTGACPVNELQRATFTVNRLGLRDGKVALRYRTQYLAEYRRWVQHGMAPDAALDLLDEKAPQLATYVRTTP